MVKILLKFVNFYIYSSLHIGLATCAMIFLSSLMIEKNIPLNYYCFAFFSTVLLYSIHRLVGIKKSEEFKQVGRFAIIAEYRLHILIYGIISLLASVYYFLTFTRETQVLMIFPAFVSLLYVLPLFNNSVRLRDINYIKIFLISMTWSLISAGIPQYMINRDYSQLINWLSIDRFFFIFAITLPFDIRDFQLDISSDVATIPHLIGIEQSIVLSYSLLACSGFALLYGYLNQLLWLPYFMALIAFYVISAVLIKRSTKQKSDYYFSGLIDGLMILGPVMCYLIYLIL